MEEELARMEARYRVGDGDGVAVVTPRTNCSQDSANALYAVTRQIAELDQKIAVYHEFPESRISPKRENVPADDTQFASTIRGPIRRPRARPR